MKTILAATGLALVFIIPTGATAKPDKSERAAAKAQCHGERGEGRRDQERRQALRRGAGHGRGRVQGGLRHEQERPERVREVRLKQATRGVISRARRTAEHGCAAVTGTVCEGPPRGPLVTLRAGPPAPVRAARTETPPPS